MILLSEVAEKIRNEFHSWPGNIKESSVFHCSPSIQDARQGDERRLVEVLGILVGLVSAGRDPVSLSIDGTDSEITIMLTGQTEQLQKGNPDWWSLRKKAADWEPVLSVLDDRIELRLHIPSSAIDPPVDLAAMAGETGISLRDAQMILDGFMNTGRTHLEVLEGNGSVTEQEVRYRAVHSLKGAGKTLRAAELAAAARMGEEQLKDHPGSEPDLTYLRDSWFRIEKWYQEAGK